MLVDLILSENILLKLIMAQMIECLPSKIRAMSLNSRTGQISK
jgi:hypothetical protein